MNLELLALVYEMKSTYFEIRQEDILLGRKMIPPRPLPSLLYSLLQGGKKREVFHEAGTME